jgi:sugar O-acyltransferase (sialic acid O-acetyltransferase NeuD family)
MKLPEYLVVLGAGGHDREVSSYLVDLGDSSPRLLGYVDQHVPSGVHGGLTVLGDFEALRRLLDEQPDRLIGYITAAGDNGARRALVRHAENLRAPGLVPWSLRHPTAQVGLDVEIGAGTCIAPGAILTTRVRVGRHCIVNVRASLSHDTTVGDFTNINPGVVICGQVRIGDDCSIGAGSTIIDHVTIGDNVLIGAGAVVVSDIPSDSVAVGVPARVIKRRTGAA